MVCNLLFPKRDGSPGEKMSFQKIKIAVRISFFLLPLIAVIGWHPEADAKIYSIHYASYKSEAEALTELAKLRSRGYEGLIRKTDVASKGTWYRVYAGKYETRDEAFAAGVAMKQRREIKDVFIRQLDETDPLPATLAQPQEKVKNDAVSNLVAAEIIGDQSAKIYYLPGMKGAKQVQKANLVAFFSEQEAIEQGFTRAQTQVRPPQKKENPKITEKPSRKSSSDQDKEKEKSREVFKALIMGDEKLMPNPPANFDVELADTESFAIPEDPLEGEPPSDSEIYNRAITEYKEKKYNQALVNFKEFISRHDIDKLWGQRALRHMADCHYYLGLAGEKQHLLIAAEFYKNTLRNFPERYRENNFASYRLAKTYEHLEYYPEAITQYRMLISKYPDGQYTPEAYYKIGEMYYINGKYQKAAEGFIKYLMKYRGKVNGKKAYYLIAHSFYKSRQSANAEVWFRDARAKWPDCTDVPKEIVMDYVQHKTSLRRYDEAAEVLSCYANLYPDDKNIKDILLLWAGTYRDAGHYQASLAVYNRVIERYPETDEAKKSMLGMADIGIIQPGIKAVRVLNHIDCYRDPMDTYDTLIMKNAQGEIGQLAMLGKAAALVKRGELRKAADVYLEFLILHPESDRVADAARRLKTASAQLIDDYFAKEDYLAVAYVYFRCYGAVELQAGEYDQVNKIAVSLKELGLMNDYLGILNRYLEVADNEELINKATLAVAEGLIILHKYDEALQKLNKLAAKPSMRQNSLLTILHKNMAEIAYRRELYDQAVANYDAADRLGRGLPDPAKSYMNYARSLGQQKKSDQALQKYLTAVGHLPREKSFGAVAAEAYGQIGDLYLGKNNLPESLEMYKKAQVAAGTEAELKLWPQFLTGMVYLKMNRDEQAQSTFEQVKAGGGTEAFWASLVDFYISDFNWWNTYGDMVKP